MHDEVTIPETHETLLRQQAQLVAGKRMAQMFPRGTPELAAPPGIQTLHADKGVFHYDPEQIPLVDVEIAITLEMENLILNLGPWSKKDVIAKRHPDEAEACIVERAADGVELRCTVTCNEFYNEQLNYFESTKDPGSTIRTELASTVLALRTANPSANL